MPPLLSPDDDLLVRAVLDGMGRVADAGEATAHDVHELRSAHAAHAARVEAALTGVERFLAGLADASARATGTAAAAADAARARADEDASRARAAWARVLGHPAIVAVVVAALMQAASYYGLLPTPSP